MKKETVNTFNQGLNMDLNAIVTPNDVLTDNINGAFLTFNGDELSLQPDAGNTRIPIGTVGEVKLSDGFYPIGIKEYGGVLYIVSVKKGEEEKLIEFGSYPSPKHANYEDRENATMPLLITQDTLYQPQTISKTPFGSGVTLKFCSGADMIDQDSLNHIWTPKNNIKPYIVRVQLKLDSGIIDITESIWEQYTFYDADHTKTHWLNDPNFVYYSPFAYKGLLSVKVELDEPIFEFSQYPRIEGNLFTYGIKRQDTPSLEVVDWVISVGGYVSPPTSSEVSIILDNPDNGVAIFYTIEPSFRFKINNQTCLFSDLPAELQSKYRLSGYLIVNDLVNSAGFELSNDFCSSGGRIYTVASLRGDGGYLNYKFEPISPSDNKLIFLRKGSSAPENTEVIGHFTIINNSPKVEILQSNVDKFDPGVYLTLVEKFEEMRVQFIDDSCYGDSFLFKFSARMDMTGMTSLKEGTLKAYQGGGEVSWSSEDLGDTFILKLKPRGDLRIVYTSEVFEPIEVVLRESTVRDGLANNPEWRMPVIPLILPTEWKATSGVTKVMKATGVNIWATDSNMYNILEAGSSSVFTNLINAPFGDKVGDRIQITKDFDGSWGIAALKVPFTSEDGATIPSSGVLSYNMEISGDFKKNGDDLRGGQLLGLSSSTVIACGRESLGYYFFRPRAALRITYIPPIDFDLTPRI